MTYAHLGKRAALLNSLNADLYTVRFGAFGIRANIDAPVKSPFLWAIGDLGIWGLRIISISGAYLALPI